jgi:protocatechuate 3,4-dioxygenase beta subunit
MLSAQLFGRREVLVLGATSVLMLAGLGRRDETTFAQNSIVTTPGLTEGPYFVDELLQRSDIRVDPTDNTVQNGLPLRLRIIVSQINDGVLSPLPGAYVDIWHCNALGVYSDVQAQSTVGKKFLRGYQITNRHGEVRFLTIYPGWYTGRTVHIHVKVRLFAGSLQTYEFTTQLFFDDAKTDIVYQAAPYNQRGARDTFNSEDAIFLGASDDGTVQSNSGALLLPRLVLTGGNNQGVASFQIKRDDF